MKADVWLNEEDWVSVLSIGFNLSKSQVRRLIGQNGISLEEVVLKVKKGKREWREITIKK